MRRDPEYFGETELELVYIATKLKDALRLEELLDQAGLNYAVEADNYQGGVIFRSERVGAFFYVQPEFSEAAHEVLAQNGLRGVTSAQ